MDYILVCVKDELTGFTGVNVSLNEQVAIREFTQAVNSIEQFKNNANDYALYKLGVFNTETGITMCEPTKIVGANAVLKEVKHE